MKNGIVNSIHSSDIVRLITRHVGNAKCITYAEWEAASHVKSGTLYSYSRDSNLNGAKAFAALLANCPEAFQEFASHHGYKLTPLHAEQGHGCDFEMWAEAASLTHKFGEAGRDKVFTPSEKVGLMNDLKRFMNRAGLYMVESMRGRAA